MTALTSIPRLEYSTIRITCSEKTASSTMSSGGTRLALPRARCCWSSTFIWKRDNMEKRKPSASFPRERRTVVSAESIFNKPLSKKQKAVLARVAKRQAVGDDARINYSDIPPLTDRQLAGFRRASKVLVAARLDRDVVDWLKKYGEG